MTTSIPERAVLVRTTDVFDEANVPAGLLRAHRIGSGTWGRLVVHGGTMRLVFEDDSEPTVELGAGGSAVIPPGIPHHVELHEGASFAVEFHRDLASG